VSLDELDGAGSTDCSPRNPVVSFQVWSRRPRTISSSRLSRASSASASSRSLRAARRSVLPSIVFATHCRLSTLLTLLVLALRRHSPGGCRSSTRGRRRCLPSTSPGTRPRPTASTPAGRSRLATRTTRSTRAASPGTPSQARLTGSSASTAPSSRVRPSPSTPTRAPRSTRARRSASGPSPTLRPSTSRSRERARSRPARG
jgi:hypothetical protein